VALAFSLIVARANPRVRLRLAFDTSHVLTDSIRRGTAVEAARIWTNYDVTIDADGEATCGAEESAGVTVVVDVGHDTGQPETGLGAIRFAPDGSPDSTIVLYLDPVVRIATSAPFMGLHPALWPDGLRDEIIARALGRALAHELGHFLLRSPHHADSGLMRASQKGAALGAPNRRPFGLTDVDQQRLRIALAAPLLAAVPRDLGAECAVVATR
jgi:hypothetical protein